MKWECYQCNLPVKQPCCKIETAKLKKGVLPYPVATNTCILIDTVNAAWHRTPKSSLVANDSESHNTGSPKLPPCACCEERASLGHYLEKGYNFCPFCGRQLRASA